jgi:hypothetical protein
VFLRLKSKSKPKGSELTSKSRSTETQKITFSEFQPFLKKTTSRVEIMSNQHCQSIEGI